MLYLAVPIETYQDFFQLSFVQRTLDRYQVKLIIYEPKYLVYPVTCAASATVFPVANNQII